VIETSKIAQLRRLLHSMEESLGLVELSSTERDVYYAASELSEQDRIVRSDDLQEHPLINGVAKPTYFRALKTLVKLGYLHHAAGTKTGKYVVDLPSE
jgi:hypothetical protein